MIPLAALLTLIRDFHEVDQNLGKSTPPRGLPASRCPCLRLFWPLTSSLPPSLLASHRSRSKAAGGSVGGWVLPATKSVRRLTAGARLHLQGGGLCGQGAGSEVGTGPAGCGCRVLAGAVSEEAGGGELRKGQRRGVLGTRGVWLWGKDGGGSRGKVLGAEPEETRNVS